MFLWGQAVQLPPEAQVVHEGQGNQEHQQYQEHPKKMKATGTVITGQWKCLFVWRCWILIFNIS